MVKKTVEQNQQWWRSDGQMRTKRFCKCCRRQKFGVSNKGYCVACSVGKVKKATIQMINKKGRIYQKWRKAFKRAAREA